jgi:peptidoglycan lytic transglycosylase A
MSVHATCAVSCRVNNIIAAAAPWRQVLKRMLRGTRTGALLLGLAASGLNVTTALAEPATTKAARSMPSFLSLSAMPKVSKALRSISAAKSQPRASHNGTPGVQFEAVGFNRLPGWQQDDHLAALKTFVKSCARVQVAARAGSRSGRTPPDPGLLSACEDANALISAKPFKAAARLFFETHFTPHRVVHDGPDGLLTGYYEPVVKGARQRSAAFTTPLMKRPGDLINLVAESERGAKADKLTHARKKGTGWAPYPTRQEIELGALAGQGLELIYLKDPIDVFFMQIQGSGRISLPDGTHVRVTYDGKNGHPYTSIGRYLINKGLFPAHRMSLAALKAWLRKNPDKMHEVLWQNRSYVFFRELQGDQAVSAMGVLEIPLTAGRSLAVDTRFHAIGTPVYVAAPEITHVTADKRPFQRLMIAQDVGSAIRGPERGDIYCGSGDRAGRCAGITKHKGTFYVLLPRTELRGPVIEAKGRRVIRQARQ